MLLIDTACIVCDGVCVIVWCPSICLSVSAVDRCSSLRQVCCCGPSGQRISIDCFTASSQQQWHHSSMVVSSKGKQCHVSSCRKRLNTDLFPKKFNQNRCRKKTDGEMANSDLLGNGHQNGGDGSVAGTLSMFALTAGGWMVRSPI